MKKHRAKKGKAGEVDLYVGTQIRAARKHPFMSQEDLAEALGVTFQQVQKYERGKNRVSAGTLYRIAKIFELPVSFFFPDDRKTDDAHASAQFLGAIRNMQGVLEEIHHLTKPTILKQKGISL